MPVIGHALVGAATGLLTHSSREAAAAPVRTRQISRDAWLLVAIVLAYLPDIAAQSLHAAGVSQVSRFTHSLGFALVAAPLAGLAIALLRLATPALAILLSFVSILLHVGLDVLQGTDRAILWPFTPRRLSIGVSLLPTGLAAEAAVIGGLVLAAIAVARACGRRVPLPRIGVLPGLGIALVLGMAITTHTLRDARERQLRAAKYLVEGRHDYGAALDLLDRADRWPSPARPGRVDYLRAEAYLGLGDRERAERCYVRSYAADPSYFWTVADLALFYASGPEPAEVRRAAVAPYRARLTSSFARRRELASTLARIEAHLRRGPQ